MSPATAGSGTGSVVFSGRYTFTNGPVAQLGARFHGMEEVKGSNPFRSTKFSGFSTQGATFQSQFLFQRVSKPLLRSLESALSK